MVEGAVMDDRVVRRGVWYGAFVAVALVAPLLTMVNIVGASPQALHPTCSHLVGDVTSWHFQQDPGRLAPGTPVYNVSVVTSADPLHAAGDTIQIVVEAYESGADDVQVGRRMGFAIVPYRMHDPATGNTTFEGWRLCDAKAGGLWASQEGALGRVALAALVHAGAGAWLAFALEAGRRRDRLRLGSLLASVAAGVLLAVFAAAALSGTPSALFPTSTDDGVAASGTAFGMSFLMLGLAVAASLRSRPIGSATLVISGACVLTLALAQLMVSFRTPTAVVAEPFVAILFAAAALVGVAAHRALPGWLPMVFAGALALLAALILVGTSRSGLAIAVTYAGVPVVLATAAMADAVQRWTATRTRR